MRLATYGQRVGRLLAERQVIGMLSIDFVAARDHGQQWRLYALEVNLRKGGTTPPIVVLSSLLPGSYDAYGRWRLPGIGEVLLRHGPLGPAWTGLPPGQVIDGHAPPAWSSTVKPGPVWCSTCCPASPSTAGSA